MTEGFPGTKHIRDSECLHEASGMSFFEVVGRTCGNHSIQWKSSFVGMSLGDTVREQLKKFVQTSEITSLMKQRDLSWAWQRDDIDTPALYSLIHLGGNRKGEFGTTFDLHLVASLLQRRGVENRVVRHDFCTNVYRHILPLAQGDQNIRSTVLKPHEVRPTDVVVVFHQEQGTSNRNHGPHWESTKYDCSAFMGQLYYEEEDSYPQVGQSTCSAITVE